MSIHKRLKISQFDLPFGWKPLHEIDNIREEFKFACEWLKSNSILAKNRQGLIQTSDV